MNHRQYYKKTLDASLRIWFNVTMKTKHCNSCDTDKPLSAFPLGCLRKDGTRYGSGRSSQCKACQSKRYKERRLAWKPAKRREVAAKEKAYRDSNPHAMRAKWANQHARRVGAEGTLSRSDVRRAWDRFEGRCWVCGYPADSLDHYRPLNGTSGGANTADNIRPICKECNQKRDHGWHGDSIAEQEAALLKQIKEVIHADDK